MKMMTIHRRPLTVMLKRHQLDEAMPGRYKDLSVVYSQFIQTAILPSQELLVIMKLRPPFYHIQNNLFATKFFLKEIHSVI